MNTLFSNSCGWLVAGLLLGAAAARGHDVLQSNAFAQLKDGFIVVDVTMANRAAADLIKKDNPAAANFITPENFDQTAALLQAQSGALLNITAGGNAIAPSTGNVTLTPANDIEFKLVYPRPAAGPVQLTAPFIQKMQEGHVTTFTVVDDNNRVLGSGDLNANDKPSAEVVLSARLPPGILALATNALAVPTPLPMSAAAPMAAVPPPTVDSHLGLEAAAILAALALGDWLLRRKV